jgi:hypothetical protein
VPNKATILGNPNVKPRALQVIVENIPAELKILRQWVTWRFVWNEKKWTKPPINAKSDRLATVDNPDTWASFDEAIAAYLAGSSDGIGLVLSGIGITGVDLDDCRDIANEAIAEWARPIIASMDSYGEVSPTGTGVKLLMRGKLPPGRRRKGDIEMYDAGRYFTVTGHLLPGCPKLVNERQAQLETLHAKIFLPQVRNLIVFGPNGTANIDDTSLITMAMNARNGDKFRRLWTGDTSDHGGDDSAADLALCGILAFWCGPDPARIDRFFRQSALIREKWDQRRGEQTYGARTIAKALEGKTDFYSGANPRVHEINGEAGRSSGGENGVQQGDSSDPPPQSPGEMGADSPTAYGGFRNFFLEQVDRGTIVQVGFPIRALHDALLRLSRGWPKSANGMLFTESLDHSPGWMKSSTEMFAWIGGLLVTSDRNKLQWTKGKDKVSEAQFHAFVLQNAERFDALEQIPHLPPMPRHYYMHPPLTGGDGSAFRELLRRFNPSTLVDYDLISAAFMTPFAGIEPGQRPAFLIQAEDDDKHGGRGSGKTTLAKLIGLLCSGHIELRSTDEWDKIVTRLLSPAALTRRVAVLDNVKTLRFSWAELEGGITAPVISGRQLYVGEGRRPNTLTYIITLNGANLSKDMAQRCVPIMVKRPAYHAEWEEKTINLIETRRWEIIADIINILKGPGASLNRFSRWSMWERAVLSRVCDPSECQRVIEERQAAIDDDQSEADNVREGFIEELRKRGHCHETQVIWMPSKEAAAIVNRVENEERLPFNRAMTHLYMLGIPEIRRSNRGARGCLWTGSKADPQAVAMKLNDGW